MSGLASSSSVTATTRKSGSPKYLALAAGPIFLLLGTMIGMRFLPSEDTSEVDTVIQSRRPSIKSAPADPPTQRALETVLKTQLQAMQRHDYARALLCSSPDFRKQMTPDRFKRMIERNYRMFLTARHTVFRPATIVGAFASIRIELRDDKRHEEGFVYQLHKIDSSWTVMSCSPIMNVNTFMRPPAPVDLKKPEAGPLVPQRRNN